MNLNIKDQIAEQERNELEKVIADFGTPATLARFLGTSPQVVYAWRKRGRMSATLAALLEEKTNGRYKKAALRPDVTTWFK